MAHFLPYVSRIARRAAAETWQTIGPTLGVFAVSSALLSFYIAYEWYGVTAMWDQIHSWSTIATATVISGAIVLAYNTLVAAAGMDQELRNERDALLNEVSEKLTAMELVKKCERLAHDMAEYIAQAGMAAPKWDQADIGEEFNEFWRRAKDGFRIKFDHDVSVFAQCARGMAEGTNDETLKTLTTALLVHGAAEDMDRTLGFVRRLGPAVANLKS